MAIVNNPVSITGNNELEFWTNFISYMTSLDSRITCNTTAAEQCDIKKIYTPVYIFDFDGKFQIKFTRTDQWNNWTQNYAVNFIINGTSYAGNWMLFCNLNAGTYRPDSNVFMQYSVASIISDTSMFIWLGSYGTSSDVSAFSNSGAFLGDYAGYKNNYNIMAGNFYDVANAGVVASSIVPALAYSAGPGNIDYIEKVVFVSNGTRTFEDTNLFACSTVAFWTTISLPNGKNYLAIHTNAMVEVDPET